jgi:uncharacterized protein (DUF1330 family)
MSGAYWVSHVTVTDETEYAKYATLATQAVAEYGGRFVARGGRAIQKEGHPHPRNVVIYFPDIETAEACYNSATYQRALEHAKDASTRDLVLIEAIT